MDMKTGKPPPHRYKGLLLPGAPSGFTFISRCARGGTVCCTMQNPLSPNFRSTGQNKHKASEQ
eukprot:scaffold293058_cov15-Tisochrysis_lutea.AAC.1